MAITVAPFDQPSHRADHRARAEMYAARTRVLLGRQPTGEEYRTVRRALAAQRRYEQRDQRRLGGVDRATIRAWRHGHNI